MDSKSWFGLFFLVLFSASLFMISQVSAVSCTTSQDCLDDFRVEGGLSCISNVCYSSYTFPCSSILSCSDGSVCVDGYCGCEVRTQCENIGFSEDYFCNSDNRCELFLPTADECTEKTVKEDCLENQYCDNGNCIDYCSSGCLGGLYCDVSSEPGKCVGWLVDENCSDNYCVDDGVCGCYYGETCDDEICLDNTKEPLSAFYVCNQLTEGKCSQLYFCSYNPYTKKCSYNINYINSDYVDINNYVDLLYIYNNYEIGSIFYETSCVECTQNDLSNCNNGGVCSEGGFCIECESNNDCSGTSDTPFCDIDINKCVECLSNFACEEKYCSFLSDNCLNGETCGADVCRDNQDDLVQWFEYCDSYGRDNLGCTNTGYPTIKLCNFDSYQMKCVTNNLWTGEGYTGGEFTEIQVNEDSTNVYFKVKDLYEVGIVEDFYEQYCISQNDCDYFCSSSNTCEANACGEECDTDEYCDLELGSCELRKTILEDCSSDKDCRVGLYCNEYDYCTIECSVDDECPAGFCSKDTDVEDSIGSCVECLSELDCEYGDCNTEGRCASVPTDGSAIKYSISSYLGSRKFNTLYSIGSYSFTRLLNPLNLPFIFSSEKKNNQLSVNTTLGSYNSFYLSNVPAMFITSVPKVNIESRGESYQNVLLNYSNALEFILGEYSETDDLVLKLTCSNDSANFGFSDGKNDYACVCGKGYFCEEGKPCACIVKSPDKEFYETKEEIFLTADVSVSSHSDYKWFFIEDVLSEEKELKIDFDYPWVYPIDLQATDKSSTSIQDNQTTNLFILDENPLCYWDDSNNAYWLYSSGTKHVREAISEGSQVCNPEGYTGTCCPKGEYCTDDGTCELSPLTQTSCSNYTLKEDCINDIYNYAILNPVLPEGSLGCSRPYYNITQKAWYNTECSCIWSYGFCFSSYDLSKSGTPQGTCTYNKTILAGDCSAGDSEYVYNLNAIWDGAANTRPSTCKSENNITELCSSGIIKLTFFTEIDFDIAVILIILVYSLFFIKKKSKNRVKKT